MDLLDERERRFFVELGAFAGSFDLEAAAAVTATPSGQCYRSVASLMRQSLVVPTEDDRYRLLHSLRAYAAEALAVQSCREEVRPDAALGSAHRTRGTRQPAGSDVAGWCWRWP